MDPETFPFFCIIISGESIKRFPEAFPQSCNYFSHPWMGKEKQSERGNSFKRLPDCVSATPTTEAINRRVFENYRKKVSSWQSKLCLFLLFVANLQRFFFTFWTAHAIMYKINSLCWEFFRVIFKHCVSRWAKSRLEGQPFPAFNCDASEKMLLCFTFNFESNLVRMRICGRQFLVCGGPSSSLRRLKRAADKARPRRPSPHSFSAL